MSGVAAAILNATNSMTESILEGQQIPVPPDTVTVEVLKLSKAPLSKTHPFL